MKAKRKSQSKSGCCLSWLSMPVCEKGSCWPLNGPILTLITIPSRYQSRFPWWRGSRSPRPPRHRTPAAWFLSRISSPSGSRRLNLPGSNTVGSWGTIGKVPNGCLSRIMESKCLILHLIPHSRTPLNVTMPVSLWRIICPRSRSTVSGTHPPRC